MGDFAHAFLFATFDLAHCAASPFRFSIICFSAMNCSDDRQASLHD